MKVLAALLLAGTAQAHYKFARMVVNGVAEAADWTAVRMTKTTNSRDNNGISNVNDADFRCFGGRSAKGVVALTAGTDLGFVATQNVMHFGPAQLYMARVPDSADVTTWDAAGQVWFKAGSLSAIQKGGALTGDEKTWPAYHQTKVSFKIPKTLPNGRYLARIESIALHLAQAPGGAQFYISCGQVNVTGGGNGTPGPLVSFPGAYKANDPGLIWPNSPPRTSYTAPGPPVWEG